MIPLRWLSTNLFFVCSDSQLVEILSMYFVEETTQHVDCKYLCLDSTQWYFSQQTIWRWLHNPIVIIEVKFIEVKERSYQYWWTCYLEFNCSLFSCYQYHKINNNRKWSSFVCDISRLLFLWNLPKKEDHLSQILVDMNEIPVSLVVFFYQWVESGFLKKE